jgi:hypothetical protein
MLNKVKFFLVLNYSPLDESVWGSGDIALLILNPGTRWRWVVSLTSLTLCLRGKWPRYPLYWLGWSQSQSGYGGEEKNPCPSRESNPGCPFRSLVTVLTGLRTNRGVFLSCIFEVQTEHRDREFYVLLRYITKNVGCVGLTQWFPNCGAFPPGGAQEILKGGARGAKLFYSLKINKKHKYN